MEENKLASCRTCGKQLAMEAAFCPGCGQPEPVLTPKPERAKTFSDPQWDNGTKATTTAIGEPSTPHTPPRQKGMRVEIVDIAMPFSSMVMFMVKWAIASIPAVFILVMLSIFLIGVFAGL
jgi:hypothetical protein